MVAHQFAPNRTLGPYPDWGRPRGVVQLVIECFQADDYQTRPSAILPLAVCAPWCAPTARAPTHSGLHEDSQSTGPYLVPLTSEHREASSKVRVQRKNALRARLAVMMAARHHSGLLVFADAALEEVRLALHRDQIHPVKGIRRVVQRRAACTHRYREMRVNSARRHGKRR